jgi:hypothetical protein
MQTPVGFIMLVAYFGRSLLIIMQYNSSMIKVDWLAVGASKSSSEWEARGWCLKKYLKPC